MKSGFVYLWFDRKRKMYYVGSHWGSEEDGYICSSKRMKCAYRRRPQDFKRRIISRIYSTKIDLLVEEHRLLSMIPSYELGKKYYNLKNNAHPTPGHSNRIHSIESRQKMSEAKLKNPTKYWLGKKRDIETVNKISIKNKGRIQSDEWKKKNSEKIQMLWKDPIWREYMLNSRRKEISIAAL